ncbi:hypothetical protein V1525DRAFT_406864 [Lipomyces kononenkoae]|uniref:Uncharacterized protein n=1 Tax=Lipomyces kononenkoae TaxID=34357 RepID=A0ACC3SXS9_LIPKO
MASATRLCLVILLFLIAIDTAIRGPSWARYCAGPIFLLWSFMFYISKIVHRKSRTVIRPDIFHEFVLMERMKVNYNTAIYRFALPHENDILGVPIGQHLSIAVEIGGKIALKSYTPISSDDSHGYFDLLIKNYPQGTVSSFIGGLEVGQTACFRGPSGAMIYRKGLSKTIGMIAGGTGITPMLSIITAVLKDPSDSTNIRLIFANRNQSDILLQDRLDDFAAKHSNKFKVHYILSNADEGWRGSRGHVTASLIRDQFPLPTKDVKILLCGPPGMVSDMKKILVDLGYCTSSGRSKPQDTVFAF